MVLLPSILLGIAIAWRSTSRKSSPQRSSHS
jgi:hypothetical protein